MNESPDDPSLFGKTAGQLRDTPKPDAGALSANTRSDSDHYVVSIPDHPDGKGEPSHNTRDLRNADVNAEKPAATQPSPVPATAKTGNDTMGDDEKPPSVGSASKESIPSRIFRNLRLIIFSSWVNWLLFFVPVGIALGALGRSLGEESPVSPTVVFSINAVAIIPLASLLGFATESVARNLGDKIGALLNVTFGNAVELIIFIALVAKEVRIVQASILGSILANLLLILGMCFLFGGLRYREQLYNSNITQMSAALLCLSVISLLLPTAFHASFQNLKVADAMVVKVSRGTSVILLLVYVLYLLFQLKSHAYFYESTPQYKIDEESHPGVLADMLNSSSSSDSSSSSSSDSEASSESQSRKSRIKRALKKRRSRMSSSGSKDARRSLSSGSQSMVTPVYPKSELESTASACIEPVMSGDEADSDEANKSTTFDHDQRRKSKKKHRNKGKKARSNKDVPRKETGSVGPIAQNGTGSIRGMAQSERHVNFAPEVNSPPQTEASKRPFNLRSLSTQTVLPRVFASSPFLHPTPSDTSAPPTTRADLHEEGIGMRRTNSFPGRLRTPHIQASVPSVQPLPHLMPLCSPDDLESSGDQSDGKQHLSRMASVILLLVSTALVAVCAEFLVESIDYLVEHTSVSQAFIGLIILPIVGNAAEHVTAVTVASKNKMDLAIGVALGSSIQIALFVTPVIVLLGWCLNTEMSLYFSLFETVSLFVSAFIVNYLVLDGRTNYLEGALLLAAYIIIAVAAFFFPSCENLSPSSGPHDATSC
ncbi:hypothetical protein FQN51_002057 [Onygenales sp. PD_10]|nr:hypothetical protein FQN51_002057 [Onygenales sp. PD_10]